MAIPRSNTTVTLTETTIDLNDVPQERAATHRNVIGHFILIPSL